MEDALDFVILVDLVHFVMGQADELVAGVVDPPLVLRLLQDVLAAPVVGLDGKRLLMLEERHLVVVHGDLDVLSRDATVHDCLHQGVDRHSSVEDVVDDEDLLSLLQVLGRPGPAVDVDVAGMVLHQIVAAGDDGGVEDGRLALLQGDELVELAHDVGHVGPSTQGVVDDIGNEAVFLVHPVDELQRSVTDHVAGDEFLGHEISFSLSGNLKAVRWLLQAVGGAF